MNPETSATPTSPCATSNLVLSFINNEDSTLINPHHETLVISLLIANYRMKRILVKNGSSKNIIFLNALRETSIVTL